VLSIVYEYEFLILAYAAKTGINCMSLSLLLVTHSDFSSALSSKSQTISNQFLHLYGVFVLVTSASATARSSVVFPKLIKTKTTVWLR
jgi:hypothetical protein